MRFVVFHFLPSVNLYHRSKKTNQMSKTVHHYIDNNDSNPVKLEKAE